MKTLRNSVYLMGRLEKDPELFESENGKRKVQFSLSTTDFTINKNGEKVEDKQLHNLEAWDELAKIAATNLKKGKVIALKGKLTNRKFEKENGQYGFCTEIIVNELIILDSHN